MRRAFLREFPLRWRWSMPAAMVLATLATGVWAADWPGWRGPAGNGSSTEAIGTTPFPAGGPHRLWSVQTGVSYASVTVSEGRAFTISASDGKETVLCVDARTGVERWHSTRTHGKRDYQYDPHPTASTGTPVVSGKQVFVLTRDGLALCLSASDGSVAWERDLSKPFGLPMFGCGGSPVVAEGLVLFNVGKNGVALDARTGEVTWSSEIGPGGHASPVVLPDRRTAAFFTGAGLTGVELKTGKRLWQQGWTNPGNICAIDPVVSGDRIFLTGYNRAAQYRLSGETVSELYDTKALRGSFNNPVLVGGYLYGSDRGVLKCIDWATGVEKWARPGALFAGGKLPVAAGPPPGEGGMIAAGKELVVLDGSGELHVIAASPDAYHEIAHAPVIEGQCWAAPALAHGILYCRNASGTLAAYELGSGK